MVTHLATYYIIFLMIKPKVGVYIYSEFWHSFDTISIYRVFHGFGQAKFAYGGLILGSSQFTLLPKLPLRMMLSLKVVKFYSKISNLLC